MIAPKPKQHGLGAVYRNITETVSNTASVVNKVSIAGNYLADNAIYGAKDSLLDGWVERLQKFGIDTSKLTPQEIRDQAQAIYDF